MIKVGVVDSGIDIHSPLVNRSNIINGYKGLFSSYSDSIGHGTLCAKLISDYSNDISIYNVKVFEKSEKTSIINTIKGIEWCIKHSMQIINLSLGINDLSYFTYFEKICKKAIKKGSIIVAAADNFNTPCLPAYLKDVIGVSYSKENINNEIFYFNKSLSIQAIANGTSPINDEIKSTSFAAARMTGIISQIILKEKNVNIKNIEHKLDKYAVKRKIADKFNIDIYKYTNKLHLEDPIKNIIENQKEIIYLADQVEYNTLNMYKRMNAYKHISILNYDNKEYKSKSKEQALYIISRNFNEKITKNMIQKMKFEIPDQNIINKTFNKISNSINKSLEKIPREHIYHNITPIYSIINLTNKKDIFNVELKIREWLISEKKHFGQITTDIKGELFNFDYSIPLYNIINMELLTGYAKAIIEHINNEKKAIDFVIFSIAKAIFQKSDGFSAYFDTFSCREIELLLGIEPDIVLVVINELSQESLIKRMKELIKSILPDSDFILIYNSMFNDFINDPEIFKKNKFSKKDVCIFKLNAQNTIEKFINNKEYPIFEINRESDIINLIKQF